MRKSVFVAAVIAAAFSTVAMAGDLKQDKKTTTPAVTATQMSDAEMDKVTAGFDGVICDVPGGGCGTLTASGVLGPGQGNPHFTPPSTGSGVVPGFGRLTAPGLH